MNYLLDTNIIVIYSKNDYTARLIEQQYQLFSGNNQLFVSVTSLGEINAITKKFNLGERRKNNIQRILDGTNKIAINFENIINTYGDIDAFSQGKSTIQKVNFTA